MADLSQSTLEQLNDPAKGLLPSNVSRKTVADGSWLQKYTFGKLSARDDFLATSIDDNVSAISSDINTVDQKVETVSGDLNTVSSKLENLSPLTYKGNGTVDEIKNKQDKRNGDVYSVTGLPKSGTWWNGGSTKSGDDDFKVKNNDEVAYTSAGNKWFPIGQDIHVEYSAGDFIKVDNEDYTIGITGCKEIVFQSPLDKKYDVENDRFVVSANFGDITAENFKVIEGTASNKPLVYFDNSDSKLYYNNAIIENGSGISATYVTANTFTGASAKVTNISATNITGNLSGSATSANYAQFIQKITNWTNNEDRAVTFVSANSPYSDVGTDSEAFTFNPSTDTLKVKNINVTGNLTASAAQPKINMLYTAALIDEISFSSSNPKIYFSGKNGNNIAEGALVFAYHNTPRRFGTQLQSYYNEGIGGWFGFSMVDGECSGVGVIADLYSATTAIGTSAKYTNVSATNITALTATGTSAKFTNISSTTLYGGVNPVNDNFDYNISFYSTASTKQWYNSAFKYNPSTKWLSADAIHLTKNGGDACASGEGHPMLRIGLTSQSHMEIDGNEIIVKKASKNNELDILYLNGLLLDGKTGPVSMGNATANSINVQNITASNVISSNKTITAITTTATVGTSTGVLYLV